MLAHLQDAGGGWELQGDRAAPSPGRTLPSCAAFFMPPFPMLQSQRLDLELSSPSVSPRPTLPHTPQPSPLTRVAPACPCPPLRPSATPSLLHLFGILDVFMAPPPHFLPPISGMMEGGLLQGRGEPPALPSPVPLAPRPVPIAPPFCLCPSPNFIKDFMKC